MTTGNSVGLKALSIRQPWAYAILHLGKDVENRSWRTKHRGPLLVHASTRVKTNDARDLGLDPTSLPTGAIVGVVTVTGMSSNEASKWAIPGEQHWMLAEPRPIDPVPCLGRLQLFTPPQDVLAAVLAQLEV